MAIKTFAAIDVGSFEMAMKIYEISAKNGMKEIDYIRHRLALGTDSYNSGKIGHRKIDELCRVLLDFKEIMKGYQVTAYKAYGTSALRETANTMIIQDQIKSRTGFEVEVLSNSEQRFLDYKSVASKGAEFHKIIEKGTAIMDIGGGNIQLSLFDRDTLVTTQNLKLGVLRLYERIRRMSLQREQEAEVLEEMIDSQFQIFRKMFMKDKIISNLIVVDDYVSGIIKSGMDGYSKDGVMLAKDFLLFADDLWNGKTEEISSNMEIPEEIATLVKVSAYIIKRFILLVQAEKIWVPGVSLCDGIAFEFAEKHKIKIVAHDFEKDILASAKNISKRYMGSRKKNENLETIALAIYDGMKKVHGMGKRERFLLQLSVILQDCGKFISMTNVGECSYSIIMNTEMIGLSHQEREIVANVVRFNHGKFVYYEELSRNSVMDRAAYLIIAKLTAILRLAGGLERTDKENSRKIKVQLKDNKLMIVLDGEQDVLYEQEGFAGKADFFGEVYSLEPVVVRKNV